MLHKIFLLLEKIFFYLASIFLFFVLLVGGLCVSLSIVQETKLFCIEDEVSVEQMSVEPMSVEVESMSCEVNDDL